MFINSENMQLILLEHLVYEMGCEYLSDLPQKIR